MSHRDWHRPSSAKEGPAHAPPLTAAVESEVDREEHSDSDWPAPGVNEQPHLELIALRQPQRDEVLHRGPRKSGETGQVLSQTRSQQTTVTSGREV